MNDFPDGATDFVSRRSHGRLRLAVLLCLHILMCCLSLIFVAAFYPRLEIVMFDKTHLFPAVLSVALFVVVAVLFIFSRFSFGYFLGFYFYTMILGYLWLVAFRASPTIIRWRPLPPSYPPLHSCCLRCSSPRRSGKDSSCRQARWKTC
jgi:hypothetical protein